MPSGFTASQRDPGGPGGRQPTLGSFLSWYLEKESDSETGTPGGKGKQEERNHPLRATSDLAYMIFSIPREKASFFD